MKVTVSRSGGITGMSVSWQVLVDEQPDAPEWVILLRRLPWGEVRALAPQPDRFVYRIRYEPHEATLAEQQLDGPWRELVDRVRAADSSGPRPGAPRPC